MSNTLRKLTRDYDIVIVLETFGDKVGALRMYIHTYWTYAPLVRMHGPQTRLDTGPSIAGSWLQESVFQPPI